MSRSGRTWDSANRRRVKIIQFIREHIAKYGYPPNLREVADAADLASTSAVTLSISHLEELGIVQREFGLSRSIHIVDNQKADEFIAQYGSGDNANG